MTKTSKSLVIAGCALLALVGYATRAQFSLRLEQTSELSFGLEPTKAPLVLSLQQIEPAQIAPEVAPPSLLSPENLANTTLSEPPAPISDNPYLILWNELSRAREPLGDEARAETNEGRSERYIEQAAISTESPGPSKAETPPSDDQDSSLVMAGATPPLNPYPPLRVELEESIQDRDPARVEERSLSYIENARRSNSVDMTTQTTENSY